MTSRERLLGAIRLENIDRVPISTYELCGYNSRSFENNQESYRPLMDLIRNYTDTASMWNPSGDEHLAKSAFIPAIETTKLREDNATIRKYVLHAPDGRTLTASSKVFDDVFTTWQTEHWCKSSRDIDSYLSIPYEPVTYDFSDFARVQAETGDHGIIMASLGDPACMAMEIMEFGEATVWALTETEHFAGALEELHRRNMLNLKNMLEAGVVDLYRICGPEYITPPYLPPRFFESFVLPYLCDMTQLIHQYGGYVRIHSHGKINKVLDMIKEVGADGIDPCEAPPDGDISLEQIKQRLGDKMCIFGNLQLKLLEHGTQGEVRDAVKKCMQEAKGETGYVIMPTASPINVPLLPKTYGNYKVFIETALELGRY